MKKIILEEKGDSLWIIDCQAKFFEEDCTTPQLKEAKTQMIENIVCEARYAIDKNIPIIIVRLGMKETLSLPEGIDPEMIAFVNEALQRQKKNKKNNQKLDPSIQTLLNETRKKRGKIKLKSMIKIGSGLFDETEDASSTLKICKQFRIKSPVLVGLNQGCCILKSCSEFIKQKIIPIVPMHLSMDTDLKAEEVRDLYNKTFPENPSILMD